MSRASADISFTWQPFDHGRQRRMAVLIAVGLCSGLAGLAIGRVSSGVGLESARAPALEPAVRKNIQTGVTTSTPTPTVAKKNDHSVPPASPTVVLLNPSREQQAPVGERKVSEEARPPLHRERPDSPVPATTVVKKNDQGVPPANAAPAIAQLPREQTGTHRTDVSTGPGRSKKPRALGPERPETLADYGALRDYMMGH